jgi:hypothetical protein
MKLSEIIAEADVRVPNSFTDAQKVMWLNEINNEFFDVVKIPRTATFSTTAGTATYVLANGIRAKNINKVHVGNGIYGSFLYGNVPPGQNYHLFDDTNSTLTLAPAPTVAALQGIVKYYQVATTSFVSTALTVTPDAPAEYHWVYILGLCERIAKTIPDVSLANNYAADYQRNLVLAQQNYLK